MLVVLVVDGGDEAKLLGRLHVFVRGCGFLPPREVRTGPNSEPDSAEEGPRSCCGDGPRNSE